MEGSKKLYVSKARVTKYHKYSSWWLLHLSGGLGGQGSASPSLGIQHGFNLVIGVIGSAGKFWGAAKLLQEIKPEGPVLPRLVNVGDRSEERTEDYLGMILEEVDLHCSVGKVHHHGSACSKPSLQGWDS